MSTFLDTNCLLRYLLADVEDQFETVCQHVENGACTSPAVSYTHLPHVDTGDFVIIINADKIKVTGTKAATKTYYRHSGFPGGLKQETFTEAMTKHPERVIEHAVKGMLPKNTLGRAMGKKLKVYVGAEHPHAAQQPRKIDLEG